ncbi:MAG: AAA family ATPase [Bacteroidales bacterium]|jgi:predicted AAA+ superfamily ATPase|nr:AAA family ATPase [Bacteroidales bacterium]
METLQKNYNKKLKETDLNFQRYMLDKIPWNNRLLAIVGARGTGKTTLMLQHIKKHLDPEKSFYFTLDHLYFSTHRLLDTVDALYNEGITNIFIDEVHKYPYKTWAQEIKNVYDSYSDIKLVFSGSSILNIYKGNADLSRRALSYELFGMSFREFLIYENKLNIKPVTLNEILLNHKKIANNITSKIKILPLFKQYLKTGFYPYYKEDLQGYHQRLLNTVNLVIESDLPAVDNIEYVSIIKLKRLLSIISEKVPFSPNITELSNAVNIQRTNFPKSLLQLERARMIALLRGTDKNISSLTKPDKIYLDNSNLAYALGDNSANIGNIRETFFYNQLNHSHKVASSQYGDFTVDKKFVFEVGGKNKDYSQIKNVKNSYIAADEIEIGWKNKIPLWLFGFLY